MSLMQFKPVNHQYYRLFRTIAQTNYPCKTGTPALAIRLGNWLNSLLFIIINHYLY